MYISACLQQRDTCVHTYIYMSECGRPRSEGQSAPYNFSLTRRPPRDCTWQRPVLHTQRLHLVTTRDSGLRWCIFIILYGVPIKEDKEEGRSNVSELKDQEAK